MDTQIYIDLARYSHIVAVAIGFGAAFLTDMHALSRLPAPIDRPFLSALHAYHTTIWFSVIAMWITGLTLIYIRTGFDPANFTPKLMVKILTVSVLTINAALISRIVMPLMESNRGRSLMQLPFSLKLKLAMVGAVSTSSWLLALGLGTSKVLAASGWLTFAICVPVIYVGAIVVAIGALSLLHLGARLASEGEMVPVLKLNVVADDRVEPLAKAKRN